MEDGVEHDEEQGGDELDPRTLPRPLYWWHVPERPGVGNRMLRTVAIWFVSLVVLLIVLSVVFAVVD